MTRCRHCNRVIIRNRNTETGWTHGDPTGLARLWQGLRCPGRITIADPADTPVSWWRRIWGKPTTGGAA